MSGPSIIGDLVRFEADERLDLPDAQALQSLVYGWLGRAFGGVLGSGGGVLGACSFGTSTFGSDRVVSIGACMLYYGGPVTDTGTPNRASGAVIHHIPEDGVQIGQSSVVFPGGYTTDTYPVIWFRRRASVADLASRRKWVSGSEGSVAINTTTRERVEFNVSIDLTAPSDDGNGTWYPLARVYLWAGGVPLFSVMSPWDRYLAYDPSQNVGGGLPYSGAFPGNAFRALNGSSFAGLIDMVAGLASTLLQVIDSGYSYSRDTGPLGISTTGKILGFSSVGTKHFRDLPSRGVHQVDEDLGAVESIVLTRPRVIGWGTVVGGVSPDFTDFKKAGSGSIPSSTSGGTGIYNLHVLGLATAVNVTVVGSGAAVSPQLQVGALTYNEATTHIPIYAVNSSGDPVHATFHVTVFGDETISGPL